jgi:hypothetical protein
MLREMKSLSSEGWAAIIILTSKRATLNSLIILTLGTAAVRHSRLARCREHRGALSTSFSRYCRSLWICPADNHHAGWCSDAARVRGRRWPAGHAASPAARHDTDSGPAAGCRDTIVAAETGPGAPGSTAVCGARRRGGRGVGGHTPTCQHDGGSSTHQRPGAAADPPSGAAGGRPVYTGHGCGRRARSDAATR